MSPERGDDALNAGVEKHRRWGFWKCFDRLHLDGHRWNHKRVWRVYRAIGLNLPRRTKRRLPVRERHTLEVQARANEVWSMDFMSDARYRGRRFRTLNLLNEGVREALEIVVDTSSLWSGGEHDGAAQRLSRSAEEVQDLTERWLRSYNAHRPHESLGRVPPSAFREKVAGSSGFELSA